MNAIVLYLKLVKGMQGVLLAYLIRQHIKVAQTLPEYNTHLNVEKEMIVRAPIVDS